MFLYTCLTKSSILYFLQGEEIYDAILNQTNVGDNNNKFYVIQVLGMFFFHFAYLIYFLQIIYYVENASD